MDDRFFLLGPDHVMVLGITFMLSLIFILVGRHIPSKIDRGFRYTGITALIIAGGSGWLMALRQGMMVIPLNLCDFALFAAIGALLTLRPSLCQLTYFWGLAGTLQALIQPDLSEPFPEFWWFQFFATHAGVVLGAVYLAATQRVQPTWKSVAWIWLLSNTYLVIVVLVNWRYGTNFGYLADKPAHPSILDFFGPWPYYILAIEAIGVISLLILSIPFSSFRKSLEL